MKRVTCYCKDGVLERWGCNEDDPHEFRTEPCTTCGGTGWIWYDEDEGISNVPEPNEERIPEEEENYDLINRNRSRRWVCSIAHKISSLTKQERMEILENIGGPEAFAIQEILNQEYGL